MSLCETHKCGRVIISPLCVRKQSGTPALPPCSRQHHPSGNNASMNHPSPEAVRLSL